MAVLAACLGLAGCTTARQTFGPDGRAAYNITCNGGWNSWGSCYEKAGEVCGGSGYDVLNQAGQSRPFVVATQYGVTAGTAEHRGLVVSCRSPSGAPAIPAAGAPLPLKGG
ncbi:hypothetical protein M0638_27865 [Roseomonas sp. NAR14]|uniref:Lipoprotein n=1 Tax=Roseomonas acroporae TaxID=2937791 RepID=A0A9X1YEF1_9PROT|nr:hypothetical protein [Roseomonas acroporae]MCK8788170.1 hypothetical protein [Roseomonas acroporae]